MKRIPGYEILIQKWALFHPSFRKVYPEEGSKRKLGTPFAAPEIWGRVGGEEALSDLREAYESGINKSTKIMLHVNDCSLVTQALSCYS